MNTVMYINRLSHPPAPAEGWVNVILRKIAKGARPVCLFWSRFVGFSLCGRRSLVSVCSCLRDVIFCYCTVESYVPDF